MHAHAALNTSLGTLTVVASADALVGLHWPGQRRRAHFPALGDVVAPQEHPIIALAAEQLREFLSGTRTSFTIPIETAGSVFDRSVWKLLCDIPYGETRTYGQIASQLGNRHLAQRVGQAVGANPIGIMIPCHRVLGSDGSLTGFAGGLERKRRLLALEEPGDGGDGRLF